MSMYTNMGIGGVRLVMFRPTASMPVDEDFIEHAHNVI